MGNKLNTVGLLVAGAVVGGGTLYALCRRCSRPRLKVTLLSRVCNPDGSMTVNLLITYTNIPVGSVLGAYWSNCPLEGEEFAVIGGSGTFPVTHTYPSNMAAEWSLIAVYNFISEDVELFIENEEIVVAREIGFLPC